MPQGRFQAGFSGGKSSRLGSIGMMTERRRPIGVIVLARDPFGPLPGTADIAAQEKYPADVRKRGIVRLRARSGRMLLQTDGAEPLWHRKWGGGHAGMAGGFSPFVA